MTPQKKLALTLTIFLSLQWYISPLSILAGILESGCPTLAQSIAQSITAGTGAKAST